MPKPLAALAVLLPALLVAVPTAAQDPTLVAPTDARPAAEQRALFHLPPGFEIQLVASEPDIGQPMNLQFDAAGRLWATSSVEYPYPAAGPGVEPRDANFTGPDTPHPPRDRVTIFGGIGPDGKPATVTHFAEGLNIPIGHLPVPGGALVYSIPGVDRFTDAGGDGVSDGRETLLTGFGNVDTHGMVNGLRRWIDGRVYANHGFRNTSHVKGPDGREIDMNSGNTFRFNLDGTGLEQLTHGQVNPFGTTFDPLGNRYNADCHSLPITCLIRGAYYQSFGKPHDGLGYGPDMIDHSHGSTGICGPAYYAATQFPRDYQDNVYLCNPVTGRVHRDKLVWSGSTPKVDTQPDFITCDDGWFRPVDLTVGPDGALYLADFYNAIIGHYEVPLGHPKRDRSKGRIWRIVYSGGGAEPPAPPDLTAKSPEELAVLLGDGNLTVRVLASHELIDRHADAAAALMHASLTQDGLAAEGQPALKRAHAMWVLERLHDLDDAALERLAADGERLVRTHVAKLLAERADWRAPERATALRLLNDDDAFVRRYAADALGRHPDAAFVAPLLEAFAAAPAEDTHLRHTLRVALRDVVAGSPAVAVEGLDAAGLRTLGGVLPAVKTTRGAALLGAILQRDLTTAADPVDDAAWPEAFGHVVRYGDATALGGLIGALRESLKDDPARQFALLDAARTALEQRGDDPRPILRDWGRDLALATLTAAGESNAWTAVGLDGSAGPEATWTVQQRPCADGTTGVFRSSLPNGETRIGRLRSPVFALPPTFVFWLAGHAGFPDQPDHGRNVVRLRDADTGAVLRETPPPRADVAQEIRWDMAGLEGRRAYVELQDGDAAEAYAWLAAGRFGAAALNQDAVADPGRAAALIAQLKLADLTPRLRTLLKGDGADGVRAAAGAALVALEPDPRLAALAPLIGDPAAPPPLRDAVVAAVLGRNETTTEAAVLSAMRTLPAAAQGPLAERLASDPAGATTLIALAEQGHAAPRLLTRPAVQERLRAHRNAGFDERLVRLTAGLPAEDAALTALMNDRQQAFTAERADAERGFTLFTKNCAICHRVGAAGSLVGPQLDGVGVRGLARLTEDVLDPNRNVDGAFRSSTLILTDGRVATGLVRREEGASLILADAAGKEFSVPLADVDERAVSPLSLMPANFGELLPEADYRDLMAYLLAQREPARQEP